MHNRRSYNLRLVGHRHGGESQAATGSHGRQSQAPADAHADGSRGQPKHAGMALLLLLALAQLMVILDVSAVNVALPEMGKDLGIAGGDLGWSITSYSLVFGSLLLLGGRAADLFGRRGVFLAGLGIFTRSEEHTSELQSQSN